MADEQKPTPPSPPAPPALPPEPGDNGNGYDPLNIADELKDSYLTYAMSVIISRALPDVRDGLKPSQRRILVAMHDLNLGPNSSTSKCAGIVGETMKRYHPHGEATIYPTLVRMAQDWNMRYRLVHSQGNFGSQAGLPPAAMRYCVTGDTLVWTAAGTRPIAQLADVAPNSEAEIDLQVVNREGSLVHASRLFHSGDHPTFRLKTTGGNELVGTSNHPVLCLENVAGIPTLRWRLLGHIKAGTRVAMAGQDWPNDARGLAPVEVAFVEPAGVQPVYSIRVDADCHSFITNGFVSHNTEARLTPIAAEMLEDLDRDTVDYIDNYDGKYREPLVLPCKFPSLLVNGSDGIAVGMATDIPPHNLREVCDAAIKVLDEPDVSPLELLEIIPGPDFPTGGIICGRQGIVEAYAANSGDMKGRGRVTLRARTEIREEGNQTSIVITEVPYQQTRNRLAEAIGNLVKDERIKGIRDIRDESSARNGEPVRLVVYLKRDADAEMVRKQLYEYSPLEKTVSIILLALVDGRPRALNIKEMIEEFIRHRTNVIRRRTEYQLREAKRRSHILEGQLIAISSLDEVIHICRHAPSRSEAKMQLQGLAVASAVLGRALGEEHFAALQREIGVHASYHMTEAQAEAVVRMQLGQLAALERDEILKEFHGLRSQITSYEQLLGNEANIRAVIKDDLREMRDKYGDERRTEITGEIGRVDMEELIPEEETVVTLSHGGYIKRLPLNTYRTQHRGGRGVGSGARDDDFIEHFFVASTHAYLLCFTNRGQLYWLKVYNIPQASRTAAGRAIANVLSLRTEEKITSVIPVRRFDVGRHLIMATRRGLVKKTALQEYSRVKSGGIIGINLDEGDTLIDVALTQPGDEVVLCTRNGMAIRFDEADARAMGRNTRGVKGINLQGDDEVVGMVVADPEGYLLTVSENGYGKRTPFGANTAGHSHAESEEAVEEVSEEPAVEEPGEEAAEEGGRGSSSMHYRKQRRGGKGIRDIRTSQRNGAVVGVVSVRDSDDIMLITTGGMVNRTHISEIRVVGRNTQGVRIMGLKEGDKIASIARVAQEEPERPEEASPEAVEGPSAAPETDGQGA